MNKRIFITFHILFALFFIFTLSACKEDNKEPSVIDEKCIHEFVDGKCIHCNLECKHIFLNSKCIVCDYECHHETLYHGKCTLCGINYQKICEHEYVDGICKLCDFECEHEHITNGICDHCLINVQNVCNHHFVNGLCDKCDYECPHEHKENGICANCGLDFSHKCSHEWDNGICVKCDYHHPHKFNDDGKCKVCGFICNHEGTPCGGNCEVCNKKIEHEMHYGVCERCGYMYELEAKAIPELYLGTPQRRGTVETVKYSAYKVSSKTYVSTQLCVYLPYGYYDCDREYNVLYLLHGSGENSNYWLAQGSYVGGTTEKTRIVLDNMIYYGLCEPTIVVTPTENTNTKYYFYQELLDSVIPLVETKYRTKSHLCGKVASEVTKNDLEASRDTRAYAGLSLGSMIGWSIMAYELPYFSYFGFYSGGTYGMDYFLTDLKNNLKNKYQKYDFKYVYHSCGDNDSMYKNHVADYNDLLINSQGKLIEGENTEFLTKPGFKHNYNSWIIDLYNSLGLRFFK